MSDESESLDDDYDGSCFLSFRRFFFLSRFFSFNFLELGSFEELDFFGDDSDNDGSGSGSPGMCTFPFCSDESVGSVGKSIGRVCCVGSRIFVPIGIESIGDVVLLVVFVSKGV